MGAPATEKHGEEPQGTAANAGVAAADSGEAFEIPIDLVDDGATASEPTAPDLREQEADRYAMAFRPSWAPLEGDLPPVKPARSLVPPPPAGIGLAPEAPVREEPVRFRRKRSHAGVLAALSVLSFLAFGYWAVSNTARPGDVKLTETQRSAPAEPEPPADSTPQTDTSAALTAPALVERRIGPSLADPDDPPASAAAEPDLQPSEAPAPAEATEPAAEATAPAEPAPQPAAAPTRNAPAPAPAQEAPEPEAKAAPVPAAAPPPSAAKPAATAELKAQPAQTAQTAPAPVIARAPLLVVRALPESAQLWLDGQRVSNPFEVRLPRGGKHKIDARSEGYEASSQTVRIESDAKLTIALRRATPAPEPHLQVRPLSARAPRGAGFVTTNPY